MDTFLIALLGFAGGIIGAFAQTRFDLVKLKKAHRYRISEALADKQMNLYVKLLSIISSFSFVGGKDPTKRTLSILNLGDGFDAVRREILSEFLLNRFLLGEEADQKVSILIQELLWVNKPGYEHVEYDSLKPLLQEARKALTRELHHKFEV